MLHPRNSGAAMRRLILIAALPVGLTVGIITGCEVVDTLSQEISESVERSGAGYWDDVVWLGPKDYSQYDCVSLKKDGVRYCGTSPKGEEAQGKLSISQSVWCFHADSQTITRDNFSHCTTIMGGRRVSEKFARVVNPNLVGHVTSTPAVAASPEKSPGVTTQAPSASSRELVTAVQNLLATLGYFSGPINGIAGPKTRSAIRQFQRHAGLPANGQVSETLLNRLTQALRTAAASPPSQPLESPPKLVGTGTGFVVTGAGYVLTNYHVVDGCQTLRSLWSGVASRLYTTANER